MEAEQYIPYIVDGDSYSFASPQSDSSKWAAIHEALENPDGPGVGSKSGTGSLFTMTWVLGITFGLLWVLINGRTVLMQWQENVHRRASRRRHGIPDDDDRPFNVAYAAAALARREREQKQHRRVKVEAQHAQGTSEWQQYGQSLGARQRIAQTAGSNLQQNVFIQSAATSHLSAQAQQHVPVASTSTIQSRKSQMVEPQNLPGMYSPDKSHQRLPDIHEESQPSVERRKHDQFESDDKDRPLKKTRVNGDKDERRDRGVSRRGSLQIPKRGAKRQANSGDEDDWEMSQDKRARMNSGNHPDQTSDLEDVDMEIYSSEAEGHDARGTKRGRDPSDSTPDSAVDDTDESPHPRPTRKRRAAEKRREAVEGTALRGHKRDRSLDDSDTSDQEEDMADNGASRRKRNRRSGAARRDTLDTSDTSELDEPAEISKDPACGGRRLGEIWEVNGQSFKVGLDGRRLRQALVKQRRSKFPMPKDSMHYDAKADVEVIVEKWLNDAEYKAAKDNAELAWQTSPTSIPSTSESKQGFEEPPVSGGGKRLLSEGPPSPLKGRMSLRPVPVPNPFDLAPSTAARRSSAAHALTNMVPESPKLRSSKSLSKWEKQELEAMSVKQLQARQREREKESEKEKELVKAATSPLATSTNIQAAPSEKASFTIPKLFKNESKTPLTISATPPPNTSTAKPETALAPAATLSFTNSTPAPSTIPSVPTSAPSAMSMPPTGKMPSFSFSPKVSTTSSGATPALASDASKTQTSKPSFSFTPAPTGALSESAKPAFKNFFDKAASQPATSTAIPAPASTSTLSPFAFGPSNQSKPQTSSQQTPFTFGLPGGAQTPVGSSSAGSTLSSGSGPSSGSLLSRVGPLPQSSESSSGLFGGKKNDHTNNNNNSKANTSPPGGVSSGTAEPTPSASLPTTVNSASVFGNSSGGGFSAFEFTGGSKPSSSLFGTSNSSKSAFEHGATKNAVGQASSGQSKNIFGQPASDSFKSPSGQSVSELAKNVFGPSTSEPGKSVFGPPASEPAKKVFGPSTSEPANFGPSAFGPSTSEPAKKVFGSSGSEFAKNAFGQATSEATKNIFGSISSDASKNIFKSQSSSDPSKNTFGKGPEAAKNIFGQPSTTSAADVPESGGIAFGKPSEGTAQTNPAFSFGFGTSNPSSSITTGLPANNSTPSLFKQPKPAFGQSSAFGQPSIFGQSSTTSQPSPTGQTSTSPAPSTANPTPFSFPKPAESEKK